ncbi:hypothetical protein MY3296_003670 [Beauveria thailandica]
MQIFGLQAALVVALAAFASADVETSADMDTNAVLVTFFENVNFQGINNKVSSLNRCQDMSNNFFRKASSARFGPNNRIKCDLYESHGCKHLLYPGLDQTEANFARLGINDRLGSVICKCQNQPSAPASYKRRHEGTYRTVAWLKRSDVRAMWLRQLLA